MSVTATSYNSLRKISLSHITLAHLPSSPTSSQYTFIMCTVEIKSLYNATKICHLSLGAACIIDTYIACPRSPLQARKHVNESTYIEVCVYI